MKAFLKGVLCCPKIRWISNSWGVIFLMVSPMCLPYNNTILGLKCANTQFTPTPFCGMLLKKHWKVIFIVHIFVVFVSLQINQIPTSFIK